MSKPVNKEELKKMFRDYAKMRASILKDESHTGERATMHRRVVNAMLTYANEYKEAFPATTLTNPSGV